MVKKTNNKPKKSNLPAPRRKRKVVSKTRMIASNLDQGAMQHARMLLDPCNANMTQPVYSGMGTGQYRRCRVIFSPPATAAEGTYEFCPGSNSKMVATHVSANIGNPYTFNESELFPGGILPAEIENRCIAACVRIRYLGSEYERGGCVGTRTSPFRYFAPNQVTTNADALTSCTLINRVGEVMHEVKFVPGVGDELFSPSWGTTNNAPRQLGSFGFTWSNMLGSQFQVEVTAIIEIEAAVGTVPAPIAPTSRNTLNQVLTALGPPAQWAYGHVIAPTIRSAATGIVQSLTSGINTVSLGTKLLTL